MWGTAETAPHTPITFCNQASELLPESCPKVGSPAVRTCPSGNASVTTAAVAAPALKLNVRFTCAITACTIVFPDAVMGRRATCTGCAGSAPRTNGQNAELVPALTVITSARSAGVPRVLTIQLAMSPVTPALDW